MIIFKQFNYFVTSLLNHLKNLEHKRKCISCGKLKPREELIKITKEHDSGNVIIQPNSKTFGRSAYLCYNQLCIDGAFKKGRLNKVLKTGVNIDKYVLSGLLDSHHK